ncbi:DUF1566 domain-containing protein [Leucothrix arctica]|uniref:Lcl C-terminal domain-containing protein n=1 Tax=Leucothrix arctica TaxID=1481894 RepID=A0A317C4D1_9GAMM|nr:DUF1566 domain-containing protein [Leucothrix arctica]PWQ93464.1 hypothetical protein DKT75_17730 [Leucothrix arctica]
MSATPEKRTTSFLVTLLLTCTSTFYANAAHSSKQQLFKLDSNGLRLAKSAIEWACVEDFSTGLFWQKRDPSTSLHNHASYTWFEPQQTNTGSQLAYPASSPLNVTCDGYHHNEPTSYCNTHAYIERVNQQNYCGHSDWRLPSAGELTSLAPMQSIAQPYIAAINLDYFPFYDRFVYWTQSINNDGNVLTIAEEMRVLSNAERSDQLSVRLVRGGQY